MSDSNANGSPGASVPEPTPSRRTIRVAALARVEGEGALHVEMEGRRVKEVRLDIYEPPRFFEAFLRGRHFTEVPDITARICGICPVAYQMGACHALEKAMGVFAQGGGHRRCARPQRPFGGNVPGRSVRCGAGVPPAWPSQSSVGSSGR